MYKVIQQLPTIRKPRLADRLAIAEALTIEAQAWRAEIAHLIDQDLASLCTLYQSQIMGLRMAYQEMLVLLYRPFLLDDLEQSQYVDDNAHNLKSRSRKKVEQCLDAALAIIEMVDELHKKPVQLRDSWVCFVPSQRS